MGNPIDCLMAHTPHLINANDVKESISKSDAIDLALKEFKKLHGELEQFKKSVQGKDYKPNPYTDAKKIQDAVTTGKPVRNASEETKGQVIEKPVSKSTDESGQGESKTSVAVLKKGEGITLDEVANSVNVELKNNQIKGRVLNDKQSEELQKEIESNYHDSGTPLKFGNDNKDIRTNIFSYEHPKSSKTVNGVDIRIAQGFLRKNEEGKNEQTWLLYADGKVVGEFYSVRDAEKTVNFIEKNLVKSLPSTSIETAKPKKGDKVTDNKRNKSGTIVRVFTPAKGTAQESQPFLMDIKYDDGNTIINMAPSERFTIAQKNTIQNETGTSQAERTTEAPVSKIAEKPLSIVDQAKDLQDRLDAFTKKNKKYFNKDGSIKDTMPEEVRKQGAALSVEIKKIQNKINEGFAALSVDRKNESKALAEKLNNEFNHRQEEFQKEYAFTPDEILEASIESKLEFRHQLSSKEIAYANENMFVPDGFAFGKDGLIELPGKATKYLNTPNSKITTVDREVSIIRNQMGYSIEVPLSKQSGGKYFLDKELQALVTDRGFNQMAGKMVAYFSPNNLQPVLDYLQRTHNSSIEITGAGMSNDKKTPPDGGGQGIQDFDKSQKGEGGAEQNKNLDDYINKGRAVLNALYPGAELVLHNTPASYEKATGSDDSRGMAEMSKGGLKIHLNLSQISEEGSNKTVFHEIIHPIIYDAFGVNPNKLNVIWNELYSKMKDVGEMEKVFNHISFYNSNKIAAEGLTEFFTQVADGNINIDNIPKSKMDVFIDLINRVLKAVGIKFQISNKSDFNAFATKIKNAFQEGVTGGVQNLISSKNLEKYLATQSNISVYDMDMSDMLKKAREERDKQNELPKDQKEYADSIINWVKENNPDATAEDIIKELDPAPSDNVQGLQDYIRENVKTEKKAPPVEEKVKPEPEPDTELNDDTQRNGRKLSVVDENIILNELTKKIDAKEYADIFKDNEILKQQAEATQSFGQERKALDGSYVQAHLDNLKQVSLETARVLQNALGKNWQGKIITFLEEKPGYGNVAQITGLLNVISTNIHNEMETSDNGNRIAKLQGMQDKVDRLSYDAARSASLALNQRRLYQDFAQGKPITEILSEIILTPEQQNVKQSVEEALKRQYSNEELNSKDNKKTAKAKKEKSTVKKYSDSIKDDLIAKGKEAGLEKDVDGNINEVTLSDKISKAIEALKGFKC